MCWYLVGLRAIDFVYLMLLILVCLLCGRLVCVVVVVAVYCLLILLFPGWVDWLFGGYVYVYVIAGFVDFGYCVVGVLLCGFLVVILISLW